MSSTHTQPDDSSVTSPRAPKAYIDIGDNSGSGGATLDNQGDISNAEAAVNPWSLTMCVWSTL